MALSNLMRIIKSRSSAWMHRDKRFYMFSEWAADYFAATLWEDDKDNIVRYINNQREHHLGQTLDDEVRRFYRIAALNYDDRDMM